MVEVVILGRARERYQAERRPRELVSTVSVQSFTESNRVPSQDREEVDVWTEEGGAERRRHHVPQDELHGMSVLCCDADRRAVGMVHLVDVRVDDTPVQQTVCPVEGEVFNQHEECDRQGQSQRVWQVFSRHRVLLKQVKVVQHQVDSDRENVGVEQKNCDGLPGEGRPASRVFLPRPGQVVALVSFDEWELEVVEEPVDEVATQVDEVVEARHDEQKYCSVAQLVVLLPFEQRWPEVGANSGDSNKEA